MSAYGSPGRADRDGGDGNGGMTSPQPATPLEGGGQHDHWLVVPLFGDARTAEVLVHRLQGLLEAGFGVVVVDNTCDSAAALHQLSSCAGGHRCRSIGNGNRGGIAGGFNRGIAAAMAAGATIITLLDQDSSMDACSLRWLREPLERHPGARLLVGPRIWDQRRACWHQPANQRWRGYPRTRLLISSGTTFATGQWSLLGPLDEVLFIDFVDHAWCFRAQAAGFVLLQHPQARLDQQFGEPHPHRFCRLLGLELYSPQRHYYSLRNLRWLLRQGWVPLDLRCKEMVKMLVKPWLWLLFEPHRRANARAVIAALWAPLPPASGVARPLARRAARR